jgi:hypothetical protein
LQSSLGLIRYRLAQMVDRKRGKSFTPLVSALAIPAHDHYLEEAMEPATGLVVHVSYRGATSEVERIQSQLMSHATVHGRLREFAQAHNPFRERKEILFRFRLVDGTKVHLQGAGGKDLGHIEMHWALASLGSLLRFEPVGFWDHTGWKEIRKDLNHRLDYR